MHRLLLASNTTCELLDNVPSVIYKKQDERENLVYLRRYSYQKTRASAEPATL